MQGIYTYIPETNYVPRDYSVVVVVVVVVTTTIIDDVDSTKCA